MAVGAAPSPASRATIIGRTVQAGWLSSLSIVMFSGSPEFVVDRDQLALGVVVGICTEVHGSG